MTSRGTAPRSPAPLPPPAARLPVAALAPGVDAAARPPAPGAWAGRARRALGLVAWALVVALLAQVFTAGMGVFAHPGWWTRHRTFVHAFEWLAPLALVLALVGRTPRVVVGLAAGTVALLAAQYTTAHLRLAAGAQAWAALHPVTAVLLVWTAGELARRAVQPHGGARTPEPPRPAARPTVHGRVGA